MFDAYEGHEPRVVVIDRRPNTLTLRMLERAGLPKNGARPGTVTTVSTLGTTVTASLLVLLAEVLALRLDNEGLTAANATSTKLAELVVAVPRMLRWSFLLRPPSPIVEYGQRINLTQAARHGYVPLNADPETTLAALRARRGLRATLGKPSDERIDEALAADGFVEDASRGHAYLPVGLTAEQLLEAAGGSELAQARRVMPAPARLERVLAAETDTGFMGVSLDTGREVKVP